MLMFVLHFGSFGFCRSQWPCGLRRRSAAARLLRSWVRIPPGAWMFVCCECCVLSGRGLCDELITRPEESYRLWCFVVCDLETWTMRRSWPALGRSATEKKCCLSVSQQSAVPYKVSALCTSPFPACTKRSSLCCCPITATDSPNRHN